MKKIIFLEKNGHIAYCLGKQLHLLAQLVNSVKQICCVWWISDNLYANCDTLLCYLASGIVAHCILLKK